MDFHSRYARHNLAIQLFDQLKRINKGKEVSDLDFASPVEKAMELLRTLIGNSQMYPKDSQKTLEKIMVLLQNPHINVPDLSEQVRKTTALDDDHKAWIGEITSSISQMTSQPRRAAQLSDRSQAESSDVGVHNAEILSLLTTVDQWDFDLFRFDALVNQRPLSALAEHLFMVSFRLHIAFLRSLTAIRNSIYMIRWIFRGTGFTGLSEASKKAITILIPVSQYSSRADDKLV